MQLSFPFFKGTGVLRRVKYNRINIFVDPFCRGNQVTNWNSPFLSRVITGRLMFNVQFKNFKVVWAAIKDMYADIKKFKRITLRKKLL